MFAALLMVLAWNQVGGVPLSVSPRQSTTATSDAKSDESKKLEGPVGKALLDKFAGEHPFTELTILIATLPDPRASHLDWAFDSHVDALRRAFERAGFVLDRFELPWSTPAADVPKLPEVPGVMLFREKARASKDLAELDPLHRRVWLVYLVGELSTEGIDKKALEKALEARLALTRDSKELLIVGPVFSGSSPSLRIALTDSPNLAGTERVTIVSGSATSPNNRPLLSFGTKPQVSFSTTVHTDDALLEVLKQKILPDFDLAPGEVAVFQESTTDYGQSSLPESKAEQELQAPDALARAADATVPVESGSEFVVVPFPMSLASLRTAYFKTNKTVAALAGPGNVASASVVLDLGAEPERAETTGSSSLLTPASIDLLMDEMARMLAQRGIRAVLLLASDVRDKLFLGSELKKRLPDLQLFTFEGNVLYLRPEYNRWLRGMVVLSTYPLLLRDASWRAQSSTTSEQVLFSNEGAEGTFNAVLVQLGAQALLTDYCPPLRDGSVQRGGQPAGEIPPVWVSAVGAGTMLPIGAFASQDAQTETLLPARSLVAPSSPQGSSKGRRFLVVASVSILSFLLLGKVAWRRSRRVKRLGLRDRILALAVPDPKASWAERDACLHRISLAIHHELYVALVCVALIGLILPHVVLLVASPGPMRESPMLPVILGSLAVIAGLVEMGISAGNALSTALEHRGFASGHLSGEWSADASVRSAWKLEIVLRILVGLLGLIYLALHVWLCVQISLNGARPAQGDPTLFRLFLHRAIEVDQGISPLVPLFLIGIAVFVWCQWHLLRIRGLAHVEVGEIAWAESSSDLRTWTTTLRERLFRVVPDAAGVGLLLVLVVGFAWMFLQVERTLDGFVQCAQGQVPIFDFVLATGLVGALAASTWATYRLISIWKAFAALLRHSGSLLFRLPFAELRKTRGVRASMGLWPAMKHTDFVSVARGAWEQVTDPGRETAQRSGWAAETRAWASARTREDPLEAPRGTGQALSSWMLASAAPGEDSKLATAALQPEQEAAAIESVLYVEWILGHIRRLCFFLLVSVVLTTLLISSYPFQPQALFQTISLFIFAGVVACMVWVIGSMNRNDILSRMSGSTPGELTWDRTLYANLALYGIVPAVTLISSQFPMLRETLFKWVDPLVKFVVSA